MAHMEREHRSCHHADDGYVLVCDFRKYRVCEQCGPTLSGGEKQRISIACAILKNASIVILNEAIASKTVIVIAHRLATIEHADQILVVDNGMIVQKGKHSELLAQTGLYQKFISIREHAEGWRIA